MDRVYFSAFLMVLLTYVAIGQVIKVGDPCDVGEHENNNGSYGPHPDNCSMYLQCLHGSYGERACSPGLHWNVEEVACDWPQKANCETVELEQKDIVGGPCSVGDHAANAGLYRPHPDCGKYLQCLHGTFGERSCAGGLHWNPEREACDWPPNAKCDPRFKDFVGQIYPLPPIQRPLKY